MKRIRTDCYDKIMTNFDLDENTKYVVRFKFTSEIANHKSHYFGLVRNNFPTNYLENENMTLDYSG